jgi:hypothetical protein
LQKNSIFALAILLDLMDADQEQFLKDELSSLVLMATVQRAKVYAPNSPEQNKRGFQTGLRSKLEDLATQYKNEVDEETHIQNIIQLSDSLTQDHKDILNGGRFRIGTAQKALNLYLKYLWCLGKIPRPPHCPFDFQIIGKLTDYKGPSWTTLDLAGDYRGLVAAAKRAAKGVSLATWELQTYNNAQPPGAVDAQLTAHP